MAQIEEVSGGGVWSASGNKYTLDLGSIATGSGPVTVGLGIRNAAAGPVDLLSGSFLSSGSSAFTLAGFDPFSGLDAGQADTALTQRRQ